MADTKKLKIVESELIRGFREKYQCDALSFTKNELNSMFLMEPDLVAYDKNKGILYIGEVTVSGYNGHRGSDFHIGAARKFAECFSKFYLLNHMEENNQEISKRIGILKPACHFKKISCHLIVPEGSRFIKALGYRKKLLETGVMALDEVPLSKTAKGTMLEILKNAKNEMPTKDNN
jgi:hypothetical protein